MKLPSFLFEIETTDSIHERIEKLRQVRPIIKPVRIHILLLVILTFLLINRTVCASESPVCSLLWDENSGVVLKTANATILLDKSEQMDTPVMRFLPDRGEKKLEKPVIVKHSLSQLVLHYEISTPAGVIIKVAREIEIKNTSTRADLVEKFTLTFPQPITYDTEVERCFSVLPANNSEVANKMSIWPLKSGWAKSIALNNDFVQCEYRLGNPLTGAETMELALPTVQADIGDAVEIAFSTDPRFSSLFGLRSFKDGVCGSIRYRYAGSIIPLKDTEERTFGVSLWTPNKGRKYGASIDAFFDTMLPDVPPGPAWIHQIAMVGFDYLSKNGKGWEKDVNSLTFLLTPQERGRVVLCLHGYYDAIGNYCFDDANNRIKPQWVAMARTRKVSFTPDEVKRKLRLARSKGFKVLLYFADGLLQDSDTPCYRADWDFRDLQGNRVTGWQGPDTWGTTYARNPAHPEVVHWYKRYLAALLKEYGPEVDGFVWDETYHIRTGAKTLKPTPAYCDRAMLDLVKQLTLQVRAYDPEKVFLASDCISAQHADVPGYAMVASGLYQDTMCLPWAWSYALFPNWRNCVWSCNWYPISRFRNDRIAAEVFGLPVAISNGYGDDCGPSEWNQEQTIQFMKLFHDLAKGKERVRYLNEDPELLQVISKPSGVR